MTLLDLIRKPASRKVATAIPAIPATWPGNVAATIAGIATVAVANPTEAKTGTPAVPVGLLQTSWCRPIGATDFSDLIHDYAERIAICSEAGDISEDDARRIATEQCGAPLDELAARQVSYWHRRIKALSEPTDRGLSKVRCIALDCLAQRWTHQAAALGWTDAELFGLHHEAPTERIEAMGLVSSLALSVLRHPLKVMGIKDAAATVRTGNCALLTHCRFRPNLGPPIWEHPTFADTTVRVPAGDTRTG